MASYNEGREEKKEAKKKREKQKMGWPLASFLFSSLV
jgi:hypothetical protein